MARHDVAATEEWLRRNGRLLMPDVGSVRDPAGDESDHATQGHACKDIAHEEERRVAMPRVADEEPRKRHQKADGRPDGGPEQLAAHRRACGRHLNRRGRRLRNHLWGILRRGRRERQLRDVGRELPVRESFAPDIDRRRWMGFVVRRGMRFQERDHALALNGAMPLPLNKHEPAYGLFKRHEEASFGAMGGTLPPKSMNKKGGTQIS